MVRKGRWGRLKRGRGGSGASQIHQRPQRNRAAALLAAAPQHHRPKPEHFLPTAPPTPASPAHTRQRPVTSSRCASATGETHNKAAKWRAALTHQQRGRLPPVAPPGTAALGSLRSGERPQIISDRQQRRIRFFLDLVGPGGAAGARLDLGVSGSAFSCAGGEKEQVRMN